MACAILERDAIWERAEDMWKVLLCCWSVLERFPQISSAISPPKKKKKKELRNVIATGHKGIYYYCLSVV
jgi:hypothetical protein